MLFRISLVILIRGWEFASSSLIATPFGLRPQECVIEVPSGSLVIEDGGRLKVSHAELGEIWHEVPAVCHEERHRPLQRSAQQVQNRGGQCAMNSTDKKCACDEPPCTCNSLPCNNWIDNAGFWTHQQAIGGMSSVYTVPQTPSGNGPSQCLFWFIGTENTDGLPRHGQGGKAGRTILQPVLTYNPAGWCKNSSNGWCFSSWNCCPANVTTHSPYLTNVQPGDRFLGSYNLTRPGIYEVVSRNVQTGETTTLQALAEDRIFNWADITLEVYGISSCELFAKGPMTFGDVSLWDTEMNPVLVNSWLRTSTKPCNGTVTQVDSRTITIEHSTTGEANYFV